MSDINKRNLKDIANLAKLELSQDEEKRYLAEFEKILNHFKELKELKANPDSHFEAEKHALREDNKELPEHFKDQEKLAQQFPEKKGRHLKVPAVFDTSDD